MAIKDARIGQSCRMFLSFLCLFFFISFPPRYLFLQFYYSGYGYILFGTLVASMSLPGTLVSDL